VLRGTVVVGGKDLDPGFRPILNLQSKNPALADPRHSNLGKNFILRLYLNRTTLFP